jgi:hypothetical protein
VTEFPPSENWLSKMAKPELVPQLFETFFSINKTNDLVFNNNFGNYFCNNIKQKLIFAMQKNVIHDQRSVE